MDYVRVIEALRAKVKVVAPENPHPKSGLYSDKRMRQRLDVMRAKVKFMGCPEDQIDTIAEDIMMFNAKRLRAAWRGDEDNVNTYVDAWLECHTMPKGELPDPPRRAEDGSGDGDPRDGDGEGSPKDGESKDDPGKGDGQPKDGDGKDGAPTPAGGEGEGEKDGDGDPKEGEGSGENPDKREWKDPSNFKQGEGEPKEGDGEPEEGEGEGDGDGAGEEERPPEIPPIDPDYYPPEIWDICCKIIKHNLAHPDHRLHIVLVGPKGIGKTALVIQLAKTFFAKDPYALTAPQQEWKIVGYCDATGKEVQVPFKNGYVDSGIILIDELDRSDANALIAINMALANGMMDTPGSGLLYHHPESTIIATANTSGTGATSEYNTANQLDASTRDRFIFLLMKWEHKIAMRVADGDESLVLGLEDWNQACDTCGFIGNTASYRAISQIHEMTDMKVLSFDEVLQATVIKYSLNKTDLGQVYANMKNKMGKVAKAIKRIYEAMPDNEVGY